MSNLFTPGANVPVTLNLDDGDINQFPRARIYTNGTLLSETTISRLLPTLSVALISVDGATQTTFDAIREGAEFGAVLENIAGLRKACDGLPQRDRPELGFSVTLTGAPRL